MLEVPQETFIRFRGYKKKFMLNFNSAEHEILNAYEYERSINSGSDKPRVLFFLLINVRMPTTVGI